MSVILEMSCSPGASSVASGRRAGVTSGTSRISFPEKANALNINDNRVVLRAPASFLAVSR